MRKPIFNEQGNEVEDFSKYCPVCGTTDIEKGEMTGPDFDEKGWFYAHHFTCKNKKCKHTWINKVIVAGGGMVAKYR
jgi:hypothetical protein